MGTDLFSGGYPCFPPQVHPVDDIHAWELHPLTPHLTSPHLYTWDRRPGHRGSYLLSRILFHSSNPDRKRLWGMTGLWVGFLLWVAWQGGCHWNAMCTPGLRRFA
jgi:hypothetical protein